MFYQDASSFPCQHASAFFLELLSNSWMGPRSPIGSLLLELFGLSASLSLTEEHSPRAKDFPRSQLFGCLIWVGLKPNGNVAQVPLRYVLMPHAFASWTSSSHNNSSSPHLFSINFLLLSTCLSHSFLVLLTTKKVITLSLYDSFVFVGRFVIVFSSFVVNCLLFIVDLF